MKGNLSGFFISGIIHMGLAFLLYTMATIPVEPPKKPIPIQLSLFQEPEIKLPELEVVPPDVVELIPQPTIEPVKEVKPPEEVTIEPLPIVPPLPKKIEVKKETPKEKIVEKEKPKKKKIKKKVKKKVVKKKKKEKKPEKLAKRDRELDEMINLLQAQKKPKKKAPVRVSPPKQARPPTAPKAVRRVQTQTQVPKRNVRPRSRQVVRQRSQPTHQQRRVTRKPVTPSPRRVAKPSRPKQVAPRGNSRAAEQQFKARLNRLVASSKKYPARAKRRHVEGKVTVSFVMYRDGSIKQITIKKGSGSRILDQAAIKVIKKISKKLPFPTEISRKQWQFSISIVYRLGR